MTPHNPDRTAPDGRPCAPVPRRDAEFLPVMHLLDVALGEHFPELPAKATRGERYDLAELIERHIAFVDDTGRLVRLPSVFLSHFIAWRRRGEHHA